MYTDSHAHLSDPSILEEIDSILQRAQEATVARILNICTDIASLEAGLLLEKKRPCVRNAGSTPPHDVLLKGEKEFSSFASAAREGKLVAIGETGLDYFYEHSPKKVQQEFLQRYIALANETALPIIFHCREAFADLFYFTDRELGPKIKVILHCFTGTWAEALLALERGWLISISGIVTFKKSEELRETVKKIPLENLLVETDAPFLAPQSRRGKRNEPSFLQETVACIADIKGLSVAEIAEATTGNSSFLFRDYYKSEN